MSIKNKGFTLVEMSVVITLLALTAAVIVPNMARWRDSERRQAFFVDFREMFARARQDAILLKSPQTVSYDGEAFVTSYTDESGNDTNRGTVRLPRGLSAVRFTMGTGESAPSDWQVIYYPDGLAEQAGVEIQENEDSWYLNVQPDGTSKFDKGRLPDPNSQRWSAGEHEIRQ